MPARRTLVAAEARRVNYQPNPLAQKLVSGRSGMIGMILRSTEDAALDPTFFEVMTGLSERLAHIKKTSSFMPALPPM